MEKIYEIRAVTQHSETKEWFEKVHIIRTAEEKIAVDWIGRVAEQTNRRVELCRVENIRIVPHFGEAQTDE